MPSKVEDTLFNLKFTAKQLDRMASKAEKEQKAQRRKVEKAISQKNVEGARIYAENCIRKKSEYLNFLRLSARVDGVYSRVKTAMAMKDLSKQMEGVTKNLAKVMQTMDLEKIESTMSQFEKQFEDLDVHASTMEGAMSSATTMSTPEDQVQSLMKEVAEENGLELTSQLADLESLPSSIGASANAEQKKEDDLSRRHYVTETVPGQEKQTQDIQTEIENVLGVQSSTVAARLLDIP